MFVNARIMFSSFCTSCSAQQGFSLCELVKWISEWVGERDGERVGERVSGPESSYHTLLWMMISIIHEAKSYMWRRPKSPGAGSTCFVRRVTLTAQWVSVVMDALVLWLPISTRKFKN